MVKEFYNVILGNDLIYLNPFIRLLWMGITIARFSWVKAISQCKNKSAKYKPVCLLCLLLFIWNCYIFCRYALFVLDK